MSRYIDADAWWNEIQKQYTNGDCGDEDRYKVGINVGITKSRNAMHKIPSIDIVRCRECKWQTKDQYDEPYCGFHSIGIYADDYCSYGEREGE